MWATGKRSKGAGFTLLELVVVVALIALLAVAMPVAFNRVFPAQELRVHAERIAAELRQLHGQALASGQIHSWRAAADGHSIQTTLRTKPFELPSRITARLAAHSMTDASRAGEITFHGDGSSSGGTLQLQSGNRVFLIMVSPLTGRVRVTPA